MTYVVGIKNGPITVTICDSRVTFDDKRREGLNYALKNGKLFPGCTYAAVGSAETMRLFVAKCKSKLNFDKHTSELWHDFLELAQNEQFDKKKTFKLLLSSRHTGEPKFYIFDSKDSSITEEGNFVTLGSGSLLLDGFVEKLYESRNSVILEYLTRQEMPRHLFGYFYCLALMELVQGDEYQRYNKAGVGGVFHFSFQTAKAEFRQDPAVYVVVTSFPERMVNTLTCYRVCFVDMALIVEDGASNSFNMSLDSAEWTDAAKLSQIDKQVLRNHLYNKALGMPFYNFFGLGFGQDRFRGNWLPHINLAGDDYVVSRSNINNDIVNKFVEGVVNGNQLMLMEQYRGLNPIIIIPGIYEKQKGVKS